MYTSAIKTGMRYLAASIVIAAAAAVYGLFSHGVYSYSMTYAFMVPLLAGALPHLIAAMKAAGSIQQSMPDDPQKTAEEVPAAGEPAHIAEPSGHADILVAGDVQMAVVATLTAGSILKGVLDIYGTTNRLLIAYPVIAAVILAAALAAAVKRSGRFSAVMKNK